MLAFEGLGFFFPIQAEYAIKDSSLANKVVHDWRGAGHCDLPNGWFRPKHRNDRTK
ncbi:unnamed protein product [Musa banksii]